MRTGQEYLESLRDGRRLYVGGELIEDVTTHPKTRGYAEQIARYYDLHLEPEHADVLTYVDEGPGGLYPLVGTLLELVQRGHRAAVRCGIDDVARLRAVGLDAHPLRRELKRFERDDWRARTRFGARGVRIHVCGSWLGGRVHVPHGARDQRRLGGARVESGQRHRKRSQPRLRAARQHRGGKKAAGHDIGPLLMRVSR